MARARLQRVDGGGAGRAAHVGVLLGLRPAWARLTELLLPALTDEMSGEVAGEGRPGPRPGAGPPPFEGADAARVEALVELAQGGDAAAFGQLYERSVETVYRYLYVRTGDRQVSEDLTSETFVRALRTIGSFTWQ
ncbi:MAG: sigma factor, partial [Lapillicoccus sp.]